MDDDAEADDAVDAVDEAADEADVESTEDDAEAPADDAATGDEPRRRDADDDESRRREEGRLMGQKVNPYGFRLGVTTDWKCRWFADREYIGLPHRGLEDPRLHHEAAAPGSHQPHRDRAHP